MSTMPIDTVTSRYPRQVMSLRSGRGGRLQSRGGRSQSVGARVRSATHDPERKEPVADDHDGDGAADDSDEDGDVGNENLGSGSRGSERRGSSRVIRPDSRRGSNPVLNDAFKLNDLLRGLEKLSGEDNFDEWNDGIKNIQYGRGWPDRFFDQLVPPWDGKDLDEMDESYRREI